MSHLIQQVLFTAELFTMHHSYHLFTRVQGLLCYPVTLMPKHDFYNSTWLCGVIVKKNAILTTPKTASAWNPCPFRRRLTLPPSPVAGNHRILSPFAAASRCLLAGHRRIPSISCHQQASYTWPLSSTVVHLQAVTPHPVLSSAPLLSLQQLTPATSLVPPTRPHW